MRNSGLIAISLNEDDYLGWVKYSNGDQDVFIVTEAGQSIRFHEDDVRVMGRQAGGVNAIRLVDGDVCAGMDIIEDDHSHILVVTNNGFGKRTLVEQYSRQGRYGMGVKTLARNDRVGFVVGMRAIRSTDEIMLITRNGTVLRTGLDAIRETGRNTQGVTVMNVGKDDEVVGMAVLRERELSDGLSSDEMPQEVGEIDELPLEDENLDEA